MVTLQRHRGFGEEMHGGSNDSIARWNNMETMGLGGETSTSLVMGPRGVSLAIFV